MEKFDLQKISDKEFFLTIINGDENFKVSHGSSLKKEELYKLYIKLREIFSNEDKK